jgi:transcriptional regulator with XRE-family HTH domain
MIYFHSNLRRIRMNKGFNQTKLAAMLDIRPNTVSNYENAVSCPDFKTLEGIVKIFDITVDDLLFADLTQVDRYNLVKKDEVKEDGMTGISVADQEIAYGSTEKGKGVFWEIMTQIRELKKDLEEIKAIVSKDTD